MMKSCHRSSLVLFILLSTGLLSAPARLRADPSPPTEHARDAGVFALYYENDFFNGQDHGPTNLANLSPVCRGTCHDLAHTPGWQFFKDPDTHATTTIAPDGTTWHRTPNGTAIKTKRRTQPPPAAATPPRSQDPAATLFTDAA